MEGPGSTTLVVVGDESTSAIDSLAGFANVESASFAEMPDATDAEVVTWSSTSHAPFVVHDRDPLGHVASAWVEFYDERSTLGVLQLEIDQVIDQVARHQLRVPDYYVVLEPESLQGTWLHWWLGVLAAASPSRVIPWAPGEAPLAGLIRRLPTARAWPEVRDWLPTVVKAVPDRVGPGLPGAA
ncbi:hypothetical protein BCL57_000156 [Agromyces flavus]|uniref:Uncharacterized protein n=1 Tax=Agromyces flavus TaxID=589382 RepID=A0A1H1VU64_9MICO|nr:hypothetical protein [Agromyces flavus]MCP2366014.1 hypothetical protein [Agromyces flavus]GGI43827.1 hypothetical protein GCM10010932_01540 [Agromyces flavus]SDS88518.1 hypothetical protein SAMN04489721_2087 [Agromyces flavus]